MSRMIQVRNVPDQLHRRLKMRAAEEGVSLSDYILAELRQLGERPSMKEFLALRATPIREDLDPPPADLIRADRDRR
ncbi:MAG TPA: toxin-antitoxin system HicB family antitoxin [Candidatus Acidoferrum sp.]|nr:toxin-antitoxin system HicB family antitoxin [Candidatus Acidoferrum sp.]